MQLKNKWELQEVSFTGTAYDKQSKKVVRGSNYGFVTLPKNLIGKTVRVIIVPEQPTTNEKTN
jgi:putative transposon-encoded protein